MLWCASGPGLDIIQLLLLKLLHDYTFLGPKILKIKPKKTQHLKLQLPHQVESSMTQLFDVISQQIGKASWIVHLKMRMILPMKSQRWQDQQRGPTSLMREHRRETSSALWTSSAQPVPVLSLTTSFGKDYWNGYCDFKQASSCMNPFSTMFLENASFYELSFQLSLIIRCPSKNAWQPIGNHL